MTKNQFIQKFEEILDNARASIRIKAEVLFNSGAVDPEGYEDNYILPKMILVACLRDEADNWLPLCREYREEIKNLSHF